MKLLHYLLVILIILYLANCAPTGNESNGRKNKKIKNKNVKQSTDIKNKEDNQERQDKKSKENKNKLSNGKKEDKKFHKQLKTLFKLGCKPIKCKVPTRSLLDSENPIHDSPYVYPEYVVIKKCNASCSFCSFEEDKLGIENKVCMPSKNKTKSFYVKFRDGDEWKYEIVKTKEDKKCECIEKADDDGDTGLNSPDHHLDGNARASPLEQASPILSMTNNQ